MFRSNDTGKAQKTKEVTLRMRESMLQQEFWMAERNDIKAAGHLHFFHETPQMKLTSNTVLVITFQSDSQSQAGV